MPTIVKDNPNNKIVKSVYIVPYITLAAFNIENISKAKENTSPMIAKTFLFDFDLERQKIPKTMPTTEATANSACIIIEKT